MPIVRVMAVPRPVLLALLGLALCVAAFLATRGADDPSESITASPTPAPVAPAKQGAGPDAKAAKRAEAKKAEPADETKADAERALERAQKEAGTQKPAKPEPAKPAQPPAESRQDVAVRVTSALGRGDAVVFLFTHHGAADDTSTRLAVKSLAGQKHVTVVRAGLEDLAEFRPVLSGAGVSQVPSIVVAHADKPARLLEGYVDPGTLRQYVADALR
jgi:hypothetical protein